MRTKEFFAFIKERHAIYLRRAAGELKPWTGDPILQSYRFCNVYRELDTVTGWVRVNWREPYDRDPNLWFAMVVARLINWPESLDDVSHAVFLPRCGAVAGRVDWKPNAFVRAMDIRKRAGEKVFTGAYMVRADHVPTLSKAGYLAREVLTPMWEERGGITNELLELAENKSLERLHRWLTTHKDIGSFMAGQVVADVKFQTCWSNAADWWTFAAPGPGSYRGLNRVYGRDLAAKWDKGGLVWKTCLNNLLAEVDPLAAKAGMPRISAQDLQNCLCEVDKYWRVKNGEGRPRALYPGKGA